jgi:hypothetical protein
MPDRGGDRGAPCTDRVAKANTTGGVRLRALIVILCRVGLRIGEALDLPRLT